MDELPADPTVEVLAEVYEKVILSGEYPPILHTRARYIKSLKLVVNALRITRTRSLTPDKIKKFIADYQAEAVAKGREANSVKTSLNSILRNASGLFSQAALAGYADLGLVLCNPFKALKLRRVVIKGFSPLKPEILQGIWKKAVLLRDGNLTAPPPPASGGRWNEPDWRKPRPEAYLLLLLELGLGLRRHESDKAEWDWIFQDNEGRTYLEVKPTLYFIPKSKERRVIPLAKPLYDALLAFRKDGRFIVPGCDPKALSDYPQGKQPKNLVYRCDRHHRALSCWLRRQGVADGKPCHVLRKQFGSYVATTFGLYQAQKFLGHSGPQVTSDYYAGLVELPEINNAKELPDAPRLPIAQKNLVVD